MADRCPWKIHWGTDQEYTTQCDKVAHVWDLVIVPVADGRYGVETRGDPQHEGPSGVFEGQRIDWQAGDRREYTGDWPGLCPHQPCVLHTGHHGRHAP